MNTKVDGTHVAIGGNLAATPITVRINEACRLTGIGRSKLYELIQAGEIKIIKVGTITLVPVISLTAFIDAHR